MVYLCEAAECYAHTDKLRRLDKYPWMADVTWVKWPWKNAAAVDRWKILIRRGGKHSEKGIVDDLNVTRRTRLCSRHFDPDQYNARGVPKGDPKYFAWNNWGQPMDPRSHSAVEKFNAVRFPTSASTISISTSTPCPELSSFDQTTNASPEEVREVHNVDQATIVSSQLLPRTRTAGSTRRHAAMSDSSSGKVESWKRNTKKKTKLVKDRNFEDETITDAASCSKIKKGKSAEEPYKCKACSASFSLFGDLEWHKRLHVNKPFKCTVCKLSYHHPARLLSHMATHTGTRRHAAMSDSSSGKVESWKRNTKKKTKLIKNRNFEDETITDATSCSKIKRGKSGEKPYKCKACSASFSLFGDLEWHKRLHVNKPFKCTLCKSSYHHPARLLSHMATHTGEKSYQCTYCEALFTKSSQLTKHIRTHTRKKTWKCTLCEYSFSHSYKLKNHMRFHSMKKPYQCTFCVASFSKSNDLNRHKRTHTGEKPYKCSLCKVSFSRSCTLQKHIRIHTGEKPYTCTLCVASFSGLNSLKKHISTHTEEKPNNCTLVEAAFSESAKLKSHIKTCKCDTLCKSSFRKSGNVNSHIETEEFNLEISCGCSDPLDGRVSFGSNYLQRNAKPFRNMPYAEGEVRVKLTENLVNTTESSNTLAVFPVKEEIKVEEHDIDEVTV